MTNDLPERIRRVSEFDEKRLDPTKGWERTVYMNGMLTENARLQALIMALSEAMGALESYAGKELWRTHQPCPDLGYEAREALAKVDAEVLWLEDK